MSLTPFQTTIVLMFTYCIPYLKLDLFPIYVDHPSTKLHP